MPGAVIELDSFPKNEEKSSTFATVVVPATVVASVVDLLLDRFSLLDRLLRIFAYCLRFVNGSRSNSHLEFDIVIKLNPIRLCYIS